MDSALGELPRILLASGPRRHRQQARPSGPGRWKRRAFDVIEGGSWPVALGRPGGAPRLPITRRGPVVLAGPGLRGKAGSPNLNEMEGVLKNGVEMENGSAMGKTREGDEESHD